MGIYVAIYKNPYIAILTISKFKSSLINKKMSAEEEMKQIYYLLSRH